MKRLSARIAAVVGLCLIVSGCGYYHYNHGPVLEDPSIEYIDDRPPLPRREAKPAQPVSNSVWIDGYWTYAGTQFQWVPGYWDSRPLARYWVNHRWVHTNSGWYMRPGRWSDIPPADYRTNS
ncbi:MAG: hypothetical protein AAGJ29_08400 [Pseudomonadota bacterium]